MTDDTEDVDPEHPRPAGHYGRFRGAPWYYVSDDLASTVMLGPATDAEPGDDWILSFSAEGATGVNQHRRERTPDCWLRPRGRTASVGAYRCSSGFGCIPP